MSQLKEDFRAFLRKHQKSNGDSLLGLTITRYVDSMACVEAEITDKSIDEMIPILQKHITYDVKLYAYRMFLLFKGVKKDSEQYKSLKAPLKRPNSRSSVRYLQSKIISQQELRRIYEETTDFGRMVFSVLFSTGCRRNEIMQVRLKDIRILDEPKGEIYAAIDVLGKGSKSRTVYLSKEALDNVRKVHPIKIDENKLIEFRKNGGKGKLHKDQDNSLYRFVRNETKRILGRARSTHSLRISLATHLASVGADILSIKSLLGHANISTTASYTRDQKQQGIQGFQKIHEELP